MKTSIRLSTSETIKLPTGAIPFSSSSRAKSCSFFRRSANASKEALSSPSKTFLRGRTSGSVSGRYHRLNIFSLMKSPWYARTTAFDFQRCWNRVELADLNLISRLLSPTVREYRLYKFFGDQLYAVGYIRAVLTMSEDTHHARKSPLDTKNSGVPHIQSVLLATMQFVTM